MKDILKNIKGGIVFSLTALLIFTISGVIYASLTSVEPGNTLTADKWNELIGTMNTFSGALDGGLASPTGAVMAFNRDSCPSGWKAADGTNGTPDLRGVFIRGLNDFGTGERNDGYEDKDKDINDNIRTRGSLQYDTMRPITGSFYVWGQFGERPSYGAFAPLESTGYRPYMYGSPNPHDAEFINRLNSARLGKNYDGKDNHPNNIALIYCVKE